MKTEKEQEREKKPFKSKNLNVNYCSLIKMASELEEEFIHKSWSVDSSVEKRRISSASFAMALEEIKYTARVSGFALRQEKKPYISYSIEVSLPNWARELTIWRRFSEFDQLHNEVSFWKRMFIYIYNFE